MRLNWPLQGGAQAHPITRNSAAHIDAGQKPAIDLACDRWDEQVAPHDGWYTSQYAAGECGNRWQVAWDDDEGDWVVFGCHCEDFTRAPGAVVAGERIAWAGDSGLALSAVPGAGGVHCHLGLSWNGERVDPKPYLSEAPELPVLGEQEDVVDMAKLEAALGSVWEVKERLPSGKSPGKGERIRLSQQLFEAVVAIKEATGLQ